MKASKEILEELYWHQGLSTRDIGIQFGLHRNTIFYYMRNWGIPRRSHREAYQAAKKQGKKMHLYGADHPFWKGGNTQMSSSGYKLTYAPNHPRASVANRYAFEHILVWEQVHNKPLPKGWVVHHLNGIKIDNRPENLVAMPRKKHNLVEWNEPYKKRIRELEVENRLLKKALEDNQLIFNIGEN